MIQLLDLNNGLVKIYSKFSILENNQYSYTCMINKKFLISNGTFILKKFSDKIYNKNVIEIFLLFSHERYIECNFSLDSEYAFYEFSSYRHFVDDILIDIKEISLKEDNNMTKFNIIFSIPSYYNFDLEGHQMACIIDKCHYVAFHKSGEKADFHNSLFYQRISQ